MYRFRSFLVGMLLCAPAGAQIPQQAAPYLPKLQAESIRLKSAIPVHITAGQIDHETACPVKVKCWNPRVEFKTSREQGVGFGQFTRVKDRFDALAEAREAHRKELAGWSWDNAYDVDYQIKAIFLKTNDNYRAVSGLFSDPLLPTITAWNRGIGGIRSDRRRCQATPKCDPTKWVGNVKDTCAAGTAKIVGTSRTACQISRSYADDVVARSTKYKQHFDKSKPVKGLQPVLPKSRSFWFFDASPFFSGVGAKS